MLILVCLNFTVIPAGIAGIQMPRMVINPFVLSLSKDEHNTNVSLLRQLF